MVYKAKVEFLWYQPGQEIKREEYEHIAYWLKEGFIYNDDVKKDEPMDLNKDGKVDGQDAAIASKVLNSIKSSIKKKKK